MDEFVHIPAGILSSTDSLCGGRWRLRRKGLFVQAPQLLGGSLCGRSGVAKKRLELLARESLNKGGVHQ
jgi:hypothetical protein